MNRLPWGVSQTRWGKIRPHFLTNSKRPMRSKSKEPVREEGSMYDVSPCYWGWRLQELAQIGVAPTVYLERARDWARLRTYLPPHSACPGTGNQLVFLLAPRRTADRSPAGLLTPLGGLNSSKTGRKGGLAGWCLGWTSDENTSKCTSKHHFWDHVRSSKRSGRQFCRSRH